MSGFGCFLRQWLVKKIKPLPSPFGLRYWKWIRLGLLSSVDILVTWIAFYLAFVLRLDDFELRGFDHAYQTTLPVFLSMHLLIFLIFGMYRQVWRYANFRSALLIGKLVFSATILACAVTYLVQELNPYPPRSVPIIYLALGMIFHVTIKFSWRAFNSLKYSLLDSNKEKCFIYGAGTSGELLARHMSASAKFPFKAIGFIDDDLNKKRRIIDGIKILGAGYELKQLAKIHQVKSILIAMHDIRGDKLRWIVSRCYEAGLKPLIMPNLADSMAENFPEPRPVNIQDLLCRSPKSIEKEAVNNFFSGRCVLVTGAGGSIGSEICRQILATKPNKLILLDASEYNLYKIEGELRQIQSITEIIGVMGSVTDAKLIDSIFKSHALDYVLHAAAYKHVPLVEANPLPSIINNIQGTKTVAEACVRYKVKNFLLVSTDKAVRPTNIMGMTKRVCEILIQAMHKQYGRVCHFSAVRFGNVLGSSGSVIPLFLEQIRGGGPITVTDPQMTRYFMLISEAVGLVLQSVVRTKGGEIFVLDMGEPVNILEMANQLIRLAGKEPGVDIDIVFTGLRPGEKLFEELIIEGAERHELHEDIYIAKPEEFSAQAALEMIEQLLAHTKSYEKNEALLILSELAANKLHHHFKQFDKDSKQPVVVTLPKQTGTSIDYL